MRLEAKIYDHTHIWEGGENTKLSIGQLVIIFGFSNPNPLNDAIKIANIEKGVTTRRNQEREAISVSDFPELIEGISKLKNNKGEPRYKWTENIRKSGKTINITIPNKNTVIVYQAD